MSDYPGYRIIDLASVPVHSVLINDGDNLSSLSELLSRRQQGLSDDVIALMPNTQPPVEIETSLIISTSPRPEAPLIEDTITDSPCINPVECEQALVPDLGPCEDVDTPQGSGAGTPTGSSSDFSIPDDSEYDLAPAPADKKSDKCSCYVVNCVNDCLSILNHIINSELDLQFLQCLIENIIRSCNYMLESVKELQSAERLAYCDLFYRARHEILFKLLCCTLGLSQSKTDVPFSNFGVDSNRTPDLIIELDSELHIIEVSASSSFERAAVTKGLEEAGFESKYSTELSQLKDAGRKHSYYPILFDMNNPEHTEYKLQLLQLKKCFKINKAAESNLEYVKRDLCFITRSMKNYNSPMAAMLFTKHMSFKEDHADFKFLYHQNHKLCQMRDNYADLVVSPKVYMKVETNWYRLEGVIKQKGLIDSDRAYIFLDIITNRFGADKNVNGTTVESLLEILRKKEKLKLLRCLKLKTGNKLIPAIGSDTGVRFVENVEFVELPDPELMPTNDAHNPVERLVSTQFDLTKHRNRILAHFSQVYYPVHHNPSFETTLLKNIKEFDVNANNCDPESTYDSGLGELGLLAHKATSEIDIKSEMVKLSNLYAIQNEFDDSLPLKLPRAKTPFILPMAMLNQTNYCGLSNKNTGFIQNIIDCLGPEDPFTTVILEKVVHIDFEFIKEAVTGSRLYQEECKKRVKISMELSKVQSQYTKYVKQNGGVDPRISKATTPKDLVDSYKALRQKLSDASRKVRALANKEGLKNNTAFIKLPTKGTRKNKIGKANSRDNFNELTLKWHKEMSHYRDKTHQSVISGVGIRTDIKCDYKEDFSVYSNLQSILPTNAGDNPDLCYHHEVTDDAKLLTELKQKTHGDYNTLINQVKNSFLGHSAAFVSRLAHSLLYYSQMPFNSDFIRVDNLGYKDTLLIVRGGKKIFKTKASKFFRLIYPVYPCLKPWYRPKGRENGSFQWFTIKGTDYIMTPWTQMHESVLTDSISFYTRVVSFCVLNGNPNITFREQFNKYSLNVLLAYHNRRKTETLLANLRYILLSTLGDFTGVVDIFNEFIGFNYDCFQSFVRSSILMNYSEYFLTIQSLKSSSSLRSNPSYKDLVKLGFRHLFTRTALATETELALMIYSTFLMTKAPYTRPVERANNLKSMLETHVYYESNVGLGLTPQQCFEQTSVIMGNDNYKEYSTNLFKNDFVFDPEYCVQLGFFADSYFTNKGLTEEMHTRWISILNESWDEMATSTGLRGRFNDLQNFWGQKGYFVIYKELVSNEDFMEKVRILIESHDSIDIKRKLLRELNITYKVKMESNQEYLLFHAVDKTQWRGSREIYVMDIETKTLQQPIEKYMGYLCNKVDNELISIPSDRRAQVIHHAIFEKDLPSNDVNTWYLTLDCRKWAPRSNFLKFAEMVISMSTLPPSFKTHFMNYLNKLFKKRIYFNKSEVEVLKNNTQLSNLVNKYLVFDEKLDGYYMVMPYSWVMGIFNFTSSFMHAFNQKYFSYILFKTSLENYNEETTMVMFAHSDDSGGRVSSSSYNLLVRALCLYEIDLKKCNHLLSIKKSSVSRFYFEILSVIYIFKHLLALLPKFLGGLRFLPSDKGPANDMLQSYSKCIEVMVAGANFSIAYLTLKFYSIMVYRFYYPGRKITSGDYKIPVQYLGLPDSHPIMVLLCGSDAEICRLIFSYGKERLANLEVFIREMFHCIDDEGPIKCLKFRIKVRGLKKTFESVLSEYDKQLQSWSMGNVNFHNSAFNLLSFLKKLTDQGFVGALVNESTTRRLSRAYYLRSGDSCVSNCGLVKLKVVKDSINNYIGYTHGGGNLKLIYDEVFPNEVIEKLQSDIKEGLPKAMDNLGVYEHLLNMPLKALKYFNRVTLVGRTFRNSTKTIKPTYLELPKTSKVFSSKFDPAQMVSYLKEPQYYFALPDIRNIFTGKIEVEKLVEQLGYKLSNLYPETLLKLIRSYSVKHTKEIYLYSQVPSELRHIRTYTALMTFLAVNSVSGQEITGLVLNIHELIRDPSIIPVCISHELYVINNIISVVDLLLNTLSTEFINSITFKPIDDINYKGGGLKTILDFIESMKMTDDGFHYLKLQFYFLKAKYEGIAGKLSAEIMQDSAFYTFLRSQKSKTGWYGKGSMAVVIRQNYYVFHLLNKSITAIETNVVGKVQESDMKYIYDVLAHNNLEFRPKDMVNHHRCESKYLFGPDGTGGISVSPKNEVNLGYPCEKAVALNIIKDLQFYSIKKSGNNLYIIEAEPEIDPVQKKIYTLSVMKGEISDTIFRLINPTEFNSLLLEHGVNDFAEYVYTELMPNYGGETFVNFTDFIDNFPASKLYSIFSDVDSNGWSTVPKKLMMSVLPANEGSLARILIDYSQNSGDIVIKLPNELNSRILSLRSEFPEETTLIMSDQLVKFHDQIYTLQEQDEIYEAYTNLSQGDDLQVMREGYIKLMRYWGYGSLVNTIECYQLSQRGTNYKYFNLACIDSIDSGVFLKSFLNLNSYIETTMLEFLGLYPKLDFPMKLFIHKKGVMGLIKDHRRYLSLTCYNYLLYFNNPDYYAIIFCNALLAFMKEPDFITSLKQKLRRDYVLTIIPCGFQERLDFIATYNTLKCVWFRLRTQNYNLVYTKMLDRLPNDIRYYSELNKELDVNSLIHFPPAETYYHGVCTNKLRDRFNKKVNIHERDRIYFVNQVVKNQSEIKVPLISCLKLERPLNEDFLDSEEWEEIEAELSFGDVDEDTVEELWQETDNPYIKKVTRHQGPRTYTTVTYIFAPFQEGISQFKSRFRQAGENLVILTTCWDYDWNDMVYNSHTRLIDLTPEHLGGNMEMLALITCDKSLPISFWDKLLGGVVINMSYNVITDLYVNCIRGEKGEVSDPSGIGIILDEDLIKGKKKILNTKGFNEVVENPEEVLQKCQTEKEYLIDRMETMLSEALESGDISRGTKWRLKEKYIDKLQTPFMSTTDLFDDYCNELEINRIKCDITRGKMGEFTTNDHRCIFQAPEHFSMASGGTSGKRNPIKDKKVVAELESIGAGLSKLVGSGNLGITSATAELMLSNLKLWKNMLSRTNHKKDNKRFLINLFYSVLNGANVDDSYEKDYIWQDISNTVTRYVTDDGPEDEDEDIIAFRSSHTTGARLKYRSKFE